MNTAFLVVDPQNDFVEGGSLPVPGGKEIVPIVNKLIATHRQAGSTILFSADAHSEETATHDGWPHHCEVGTPGARFLADLEFPDGFVIKGEDSGAYSAFEGEIIDIQRFKVVSLDDFLKYRNIQALAVAGLALDYCVKHTVLDALDKKYAVTVYLDGTRPVDPATGEEAIRLMKARGAVVL